MSLLDDRNPFHRCTCCSQVWFDRSDFLLDGDLMLNGYQADFDDLELGWLFFTHLRPVCNSTIAVPVRQFTDLHDGPIYSERKISSDECPGYCLEKDNLRRCEVNCECAFVREILQVIKERKYYLLTD
ncbi:MAG TPA: hypothetical protein VF398_01260 [bacterium]